MEAILVLWRELSQQSLTISQNVYLNNFTMQYSIKVLKIIFDVMKNKCNIKSLLEISKGQLISKCPFGFIVWTKLPTKLFLNFCPEIFCTFLGASCRLPCLWYYILSPQEAQRASMKPPGSYNKTQGRNPEIISLVFLSKRWIQKDILKLTDL